MIIIIVNFFWNFGYQVINIIIPLILIPYLSRVLGVDGIGTFSYVQSIGNFFIICAMLGLMKYGSRSIAEVSIDKKMLSARFLEIWGLQIITTTVVLFVYLLFIFFYIHELRTLFLLQIIYILSCYFDITWFYIGIEKFRAISLRNITIKVILCILIFLFVKTIHDIDSYVLISSLSFLLSNLLLIYGLNKYIFFVRVSFKRIIYHLIPSLYFFISILAISGYKSLDKIIIANFSSYDQLGYFVNAEKIVSIQIIISSSIGLIMLPKITKLIVEKSLKKTKVLFYKSIGLSMYVTVFFSTIMFSISNLFIPWFLGEAFRPSILCFKILLISGVFLAWAECIRTQFLLPWHKDKAYISSIVIGSFFNIALNLYLVPLYGAIGASISIVLTEGFIACYQTYMVRDMLFIKSLIMKICPYAVMGIITIFFTKGIPVLFTVNLLNIIFNSITGSFIFLLMSLFYWKYIDKRTYWRIKQFISDNIVKAL